MKYMENTKFLFLPDFASAHYALPTRALFDESSCRMCNKKQNPPHVPKLHPVEDVFGIFKGLVCKGCKEAQTEHQLKLRMNKCLRDMD